MSTRGFCIPPYLAGFALVVAVAANLAGAAVPEAVSPGAEIDQADWKDANSWSCARTIAIVPPEVTGEFKATQPAEVYRRRCAEALAAGLRPRLGEGSVTIVDTADGATADLVITGEFVTLQSGSRAARFWVGFGAGKSWADLRLHGTRPETGSPVFSLRHERGSAMGLKKDELMENVDELTQDVVSYLESQVRACDRAAWDPTGAHPPPPPPPPVFARLAVTSKPDGADVYVDGESVGTTPLAELQLAVGSHKLEIRKTGFSTWARTFAVREGATTRLEADLKAEKFAAADRSEH